MSSVLMNSRNCEHWVKILNPSFSAIIDLAKNFWSSSQSCSNLSKFWVWCIYPYRSRAFSRFRSWCGKLGYQWIVCGRPRKAEIKKRKQRNMDVEYLPNNSSQGRNLRRRGPKRLKTGKGPVVDLSSSDSNKVLNIADILFQARDVKTGHWKVFVEWDDRSLAEASWTPWTNLSNDSIQWWQLLRECRYPMFDENMFPALAISGPLRAIPDEESNESTTSDSD